ncbi:MAG TPA: hypothetical protein VK446_09695 [Methylocystis sp.]|nr:hypothetical protein [Methylocystis sp.]
MVWTKVKLAAAAAALAALAGCGSGEPNDAAGLSVLRNMLVQAQVPANVVSFRKTMGRAANTRDGDVYEYWYESDVQFPEGYEAKCAEEKERGACALLGVVADRTFKKNETVHSEGSLFFAKSDKGWVGEDKKAY